MTFCTGQTIRARLVQTAHPRAGAAGTCTGRKATRIFEHLPASTSTLPHATHKELLLVVIVVVATICTGLEGVERAELWRLYVAIHGRIAISRCEKRAWHANKPALKPREARTHHALHTARTQKYRRDLHGHCKHARGGCARWRATRNANHKHSPWRQLSTSISVTMERKRITTCIPYDLHRGSTESTVDLSKQCAGGSGQANRCAGSGAGVRLWSGRKGSSAGNGVAAHAADHRSRGLGGRFGQPKAPVGFAD